MGACVAMLDVRVRRDPKFRIPGARPRWQTGNSTALKSTCG